METHKPITEEAVNAAIQWIEWHEKQSLSDDWQVPQNARDILRQYKAHQYEDLLSVSARILLLEMRRLKIEQKEILFNEQCVGSVEDFQKINK